MKLRVHRAGRTLAAPPAHAPPTPFVGIAASTRPTTTFTGGHLKTVAPPEREQSRAQPAPVIGAR
jgi:hypothetical protein